MSQWYHINNTLYLIAVAIARIVLIYMYLFDLHINTIELVMQRDYSHFTEEETVPQMIKWLTQPIQLFGTLHFVI